MNYPTKVVIEITADSYQTTVFHCDEVLSKRTCIMESRGLSIGTEKGDVFEDLPDFEDLADAVDDSSMRSFDISGQLIAIREDYE